MAGALANDRIAKTIADYWDDRAESYSNGVRGELSDYRSDAWRKALERVTGGHTVEARIAGRAARVLDLGCGPGFFSILFAEADCRVDAIDASNEMLARACENARQAGVESAIAFHQGNVASLPFADGAFDIVVSRNLMWLMRDPVAAYAEWMRVLRPGGKLVAFDANWYLYLFDAKIDAQRRADQEGSEVAEWAEDARATTDEERRCELFALELPLSSVVRPAWDVKTLSDLGAKRINVDEDAWVDLWTESEYAYYATSPLFMVEAVK